MTGEPEEESSLQGLRPVVRMLGAVVAPTTLVSALLYWFGFSHATRLYGYFGIDSAQLGLGTRDYLIRSLDALFVPMTVMACAGLAALWGHSLLRARLAAGTRPATLRVITRVVALTGLVPALVGLWNTVTPTFMYSYVAAAPLSLALGVALLVYALRLRRLAPSAPRPAPSDLLPILEWTVVFVITGLSLFWAATDYSAAVALTRARQIVRELPTYPPVVVYSAKSLSLDVPGVTATHCRDPQAAYQVRYDGFRLLPESGTQYVLLPARWNAATGVAVLLPRNDTIRLEYATRISGKPPAC